MNSDHSPEHSSFHFLCRGGQRTLPHILLANCIEGSWRKERKANHAITQFSETRHALFGVVVLAQVRLFGSLRGAVRTGEERGTSKNVKREAANFFQQEDIIHSANQKQV